MLLSDPTVAGINPKTPKQILLEFYNQYRDSQPPSFETFQVAGASLRGPARYRATVLCPAVYRAPGDLAFEDLMFEGAGMTRKLAEHDAADTAYMYIRTLPGLKLPSGSLSLGKLPGGTQKPHPAPPPGTPPGAGATAELVFGSRNPAAAAPAPAKPINGNNGACEDGAGALGLAINEAMIETMAPDQLRMALREVLGLYKSLVQAVHSESQRHSVELQAIVNRSL